MQSLIRSVVVLVIGLGFVSQVFAATDIVSNQTTLLPQLQVLLAQLENQLQLLLSGAPLTASTNVLACNSFTITPNTSTTGSPVTLAWTTTGASKVSINQGVGSGLPLSGSKVISPTTASATYTSTYTLTATGPSSASGAPGASVTCSATLTIHRLPPPVCVDFKVNPTSMTYGSVSLMSWVTTGASRVAITNIGSFLKASDKVWVAPSGTPPFTTTFTLTAYNADGATTTCKTKLASQTPPAPTCSTFVASATSITAGSPTTLSWATTNAQTISIDNGVGTVTGTSTVVVPTKTTTYKLTVTNKTGASVSCTAPTVTVYAAPVCSSFIASPTSLYSGSPTTLSWLSTGAVSASIDNGVGAVPTNGTSVVYPTISTAYTLSLKNTPGTMASCVTPKVTVKAALPTCDSFTISSSTITAGGKITLKWATTNATKVAISNLTGTLPVDGSTSTIPTVNTSYVLTAYNPDNATTSCKVSVTVVPSVTAGARIVRTIKVNGLDREYIVHMPKVLNTTNTPYQAMVVFHPATAVDTFMEQNAPFYADPKGKNLVVIYPQGYQKTWNVGGCCGVAGTVGVDDVAFFQKVLADVKTLIPIREKAYISGFSNGSLMVYRLVCDVPNLVSAAVPFAGAMAMDSCTKSPAVPMLHLNGTEDPITLSPETADPNGPYANSLTVLVNPYKALDAVAQRNGCITKRSPSAGITAWNATCEAYSCTSTSAAKAPVNICLIPGLGHAWPGSGDSSSTSSSTDLSGYGPYLPDLNPTGPVLDFLLKY